MNLNKIAQDTIDILTKYNTKDNSLIFNETKNEIMKLVNNNLEIRN